MKDIQNKEDVALLVDKFYQKVTVDPVIGHFFTEVVALSWETHIPLIVSFWDSILFGASGYKGNPMERHMELNKLSQIKTEHFERWLELWSATIHENFEGPKAEEASSRAKAIAEMMKYKINQKDNN